MTIDIVYAEERLFSGLRDALDAVAREQIYIEMIEAKPLEETVAFQSKLIANNWPSYYAVSDDRVIGWADITPMGKERLSHRGSLGMGIVDGFRGQGVGTRLITTALAHAKKIGLEKAELHVYTDNTRAIALYRKCGFQDVGVIRHYRKLDGRYFDALQMELFL